MWLLAAFIAVPLIEIALFIQVGGLIGLWPTLLIVVLTAVLGSWLVRNQGALALSQLRQSFSELDDPTRPLAHGAMIVLSGALLLTPGFFTDAVGFALLVPAVRDWVMRQAGKRIQVQRFDMGGGAQPRRDPPRHPRQPPHAAHGRNPAEGEVIDGEFTEVTGDKRPTHTPSGWTRH